MDWGKLKLFLQCTNLPWQFIYISLPLHPSFLLPQIISQSVFFSGKQGKFFLMKSMSAYISSSVRDVRLVGESHCCSVSFEADAGSFILTSLLWSGFGL